MIDQGEFFKIPSPCQSICEMNSKGYCIGCFRNRNERLHWNKFSEFQKQLVVNLCNKRKLKIIQAKQNKDHPVKENQPAPQFDLFYEVRMNTPTEPKESFSSDTKEPKPKDEEQLDLF